MSSSIKLHLCFVERERTLDKKTSVWEVRSIYGVVLGLIAWHDPWRRYVFSPRERRCFDGLCLDEISLFIKTKTQEYADAKNGDGS